MKKLAPDIATDPKTLVTPYAFKIADNILYTPLATPLKRALAMTIDGFLIAVMADEAGWMFILLVALTLLIQRRNHQWGKIFKWGMYVVMLLGLLWVLTTAVFEKDAPPAEHEPKTSALTGVASLKLLPQIVALAGCESAECASDKVKSLDSQLKASGLSPKEQKQILRDVIADLALPEGELTSLAKSVGLELDAGKGTPSDAVQEAAVGTDSDSDLGDSVPDPAVAKSLMRDKEAKPKYSLLEWAKGVLNDLGLGFGWSAFYFTVFTAWFDGQTLGKKLLRIRVIQLDGSKISLWAAFGRYGGYGAGFATGLLGFLQIYWDANRQAIQDKISATVVIDLTKPKKIPAGMAVDAMDPV
ncbi:RDD family protein [Shewanella sp. AS16]|uniref:RDD family protein n=1 Tax=Shewanella sp. AS16 TaxID=2907625 RepID=UPI001F298C6A|nr:RDD family protein [Shewanella sp. AS16]MCE9686902.1 RDD family protein [Shewanella sp. AS16]